MYYLVNWPRVVRLPELGSPAIHYVKCNRDKILIAVLSPDTITILYNKVRIDALVLALKYHFAF